MKAEKICYKMVITNQVCVCVCVCVCGGGGGGGGGALYSLNKGRCTPGVPQHTVPIVRKLLYGNGPQPNQHCFVVVSVLFNGGHYNRACHF